MTLDVGMNLAPPEALSRQASFESMYSGISDGFRERISSFSGPKAQEDDEVTPVLNEVEERLRLVPESKRTVIEQVLKGHRNMGQLPRLESRCVKIFVSSTFTDMAEERNVLMSTVVNPLRTFCREKYGIEFQLVDMRWGVPLQARDDHSTVQLCLDEIKFCQQQSLGPNFVLFLGQKYGSRLLPAQLPKAEFEPIKRQLRLAGRDIEFLERWYVKDSNCDPAVYVLQKVSSVLGLDTGQWPDFQNQLDAMLIEGTKACVDAGDLPPEVLQRLSCSVTELETLEGLLNCNREDIRKNCLVFERHISDISEYLDRDKVAKFVDLNPGSVVVNAEKATALAAFKQHLADQVCSRNYDYREITWNDPNGVNPKEHGAYLEGLCQTFFAKVKGIINANEARRRRMHTDDLYEEVLHHWNVAKSRSEVFMGRDSVLREIKHYLLRVTDKPLILYGDSGHGKTSILSAAATRARAWLQIEGVKAQSSVVVRFCGTSPSSSNIRRLLKSLCVQITYVTAQACCTIPSCYKDVKKLFYDLISKGEFGGLVIIFIDAIDQLCGTDDAFRLDWLPAKIAANVKLIVSTLPHEHNLLKTIQGKITVEEQYLHVGPLEPAKCQDTLLYWMNEHKKIISGPQWNLVKQAFQQCAAPLFMHLVYREVSMWRSYDQPSPGCLPSCIMACIDLMFDRLEEKNGEVFLSHTLAYITASRGISSLELEDLLSLDDDVLNSLFLHWEPPVRRIPPNLVSRILHDLGNYITGRSADDTDVIYWFHRQFVEAARRRYLADEDQERLIHSALADYFMGTWGGMKTKPYTYSDALAEKLHIKNKSSSAIRHVPEQPLVFASFISSESDPRYNLRKLNQLPYHLAKAGRIEELKKEVLFSYEWLYTKLRASTVQNIICDLGLLDSVETTLLSDALLMAESALSVCPKVLGPEITGRLLPHFHLYSGIRHLIRQCDLASQRDCPFIPNWQTYTTPGGPLQYVCEAEDSIRNNLDVGIIQCEQAVLLAAKPFYSTQMRVWDVTHGESKPEMTLTPGSEVYPTLDGKFINVIKNSRLLQTIRLDSGEIYGEVEFGYGSIAQVEVANRYVAITFTDSPGPVIVDIDAGVLLHRMSHQTDAVAISRDDRYLLCNHGHCLLLFSLPLVERCCVLPCQNPPEKLLLAKSNKRCYVMFRDKEVQVVDINYVHRKMKPKGIVRDLELRDFKLSHTETLLLCRASRCLYLFDTQTHKLLHRINSMPSGVFVEKLSVFRDAGFSPNDKLLVAARYTYLGIWDAVSGEPLRLLHSSISPITKLFTPDLTNKAITLLADNSIQVWNLDNLDSDVQHCNAIVKGPVSSLATSQYGNRVICTGSYSAEAKVFNTVSGEIEWCLVHSQDPDVILTEVLMSPRGRVAVSRCPNKHLNGREEDWEILREDKFWSMDTGKSVAEFTRGRFVVFDASDRHVVSFWCRSYSCLDRNIISYTTSIYNIEKHEVLDLELPDGHIISPPVITAAGNYLALVLQERRAPVQIGYDDHTYRLSLYIYSFQKQWRQWKALSPQQICSSCEGDESLMDVRPFSDDLVILTYTRTNANFSIGSDGVVQRKGRMAKAALIYNIQKDSLLRKIKHVMSPTSDLDHLIIAQNASLVMDADYDVYDILAENKVGNFSMLQSHAQPGTVRFVLNGQYAVMISSNGRELHLYRMGLRERLARCFVHGLADQLVVAGDDRTVLVGCRDGRVMIFTLALHSPDPMREIVSKLPSRAAGSRRGSRNAIFADIKHVEDDLHDLLRLSTITQNKHTLLQTKQPGFRTVGTGVLYTQELRHQNAQSSTCSIQ